MLEVCSQAELSDGSLIEIEAARPEIDRPMARVQHEGHRVLGVAYRDCEDEIANQTRERKRYDFSRVHRFGRSSETGRRKDDPRAERTGYQFENHYGRQCADRCARRARSRAEQRADSVRPGNERDDNQALTRCASEVDVFAEIEPTQKERIVVALKKAGHVVGYMGDGINDATALHTADVGLSVDTAVDVAREAADFVLLERDLEVLVDGVREGRRTFANTLKICLHRDKREFWKHVQHGRGVVVSSVSPSAAEADFAHQFAHRFSGNDDRKRQCRSRIGASAAPVGHRVSSGDS